MNLMVVLVWIRRVVALSVLLLFMLSLAGMLVPPESAWLCRVQFVPALLSAVNGCYPGMIALGCLLVLTLLFGRVYCSWLCPLGIMQDIVNRLVRPRPAKSKGKMARYAPHHWLLRLLVAAAVFGSLAAGSVLLLSWTDPYTISARFGAALVNPLLSGDWGRYEPWLLVLLSVSVLLPLVMAAWRGRLYCNTICPVGAVLGLLSRWAPFVPKLRASDCGRCGTCLRHCKAQAIDLKQGWVDATRCVGCYDCVAVCPRSAMSLAPGKGAVCNVSIKKQADNPEADKATDPSRRAFLGLGVASLATAAVPELPGSSDGTAAAAVPPGAVSVDRFLSRCTGCGLCISACPTHVLRPAFLVHGLSGMMKPYMDFSRGYCAADCHRCSELCPEGALLPLSLEQKKKLCIGAVVYKQKNCLVWSKGEPCGRCLTVCPTGAIAEVKAPSVDAEKCVGCRRCARKCPQGAITLIELPDRVRPNGKPKPLPVIDYSKCVACGECFAACRHEALDARSLRVPAVQADKCTGCGACSHVCPAEPRALSITPFAQHQQLP